MANRRRFRKSFRRRRGRRFHKGARDIAPTTQYHDSRTQYVARSSSRGKSFRKKAQSLWRSAFIQNTPVETVNIPYAGQISATASAAVQAIGGLYTFNSGGSGTFPWADLAAMSVWMRKGQSTLLNAAGNKYQAPKFLVSSAHCKVFMTNTTSGVTFVKLYECQSRRGSTVAAADPSSLLLPDANFMDNVLGSAAESQNKVSYDLFDVGSFTSNMKILKVREVVLQPSQSFEFMMFDRTHRVFNPEDLGPNTTDQFYFKDWTKFFVIQAYGNLLAGSPPTLPNVNLPYVVDKKYYVRKIPGEYTTQTVLVQSGNNL